MTPETHLTTFDQSDHSGPIDDHVTIPNHVTVVDSNNPPNFSDLPPITRLVFKIASRIDWGSLLFILPDGRAYRFQGSVPGIEGVIKINDFKFARKLLSGGTIGFADAYFDRQWQSPNVEKLLEVVAHNTQRIERYFKGSRLIKSIQRILHALNRNTKRGSQRNIISHYDLGNEFYKQWLDPTMTYSSARFADPRQDLSEAQVNKYRSLAERIDLRPEHTILEIGSGWGGFADYAASEIGCKVVGITISPDQRDYANKRIASKGLQDKVEFRLQDYRDVEEKYDRIASIEMFEAVGLHYWPVYFRKVRECLKPGGLAGLQIITISDQYFDQYRKSADFIQSYIFPGGMLPSPTVLKEQIDKAGLAWRDNVNFGLDYARTLKEWHRRFQAAWPNIERLGFDEKFRLLWKYYLSYCEAGFRAGSIDVTQVVVARPQIPLPRTWRVAQD